MDPGPPPPEGLCEVALTCPAAIPDEPALRCQLRIADAAGVVRYEGDAGVDIRGRSSSSFPKKQYGVELWDAAGDPVEVDLLGMGEESDWILNGAYIDRALFRNRLAFDLFQEMGRYAARSRYCRLTLDGQPWGIYLLSEEVKRDGSRLDLADAADGSSFLLKLDDEGGIWPNTHGYGQWQLAWPDAADLDPGAQDAVAGWLAGWDAAVASNRAAIPDYLDLEAAADLVLIEEFTKNNDAYYLSLYLYREGGAARWAPWDMDLTLGQPSYNDNQPPEGWIAYRPDFIAALRDVPGFSGLLASRWAELRAGPLAGDALAERIAGYRATMEPALDENFALWPIDEVTFGWSGVNYLYPVASYDEEYARVSAWIPARLAWMDAHIAEW